MLRIAADDKIPFLKDSPLAEVTEMKFLPGAEISAADVRDADALITRTRTKCNASLLEGSSVRFIATATIGYDHIDTEFCRKQGITWTNAPGCNAASVAQYIAAALTNLPFEPAGKTLGIIGAGHVGKPVAVTARALGMNILINDPPRAEQEGNDGFVSLDELLAESDVITLHTPLEKSGKYPTFHLADDAFFRKMKPSAVFINAARGPVCDNAALLEVLNRGRIAGAVLDVWENEPEINRELQKKLLFGTPHIAGYSTDGKANGTAMCVQALSDFFQLGLSGWYPSIPPPGNALIELQGNGFDAVREAIRASYNIAEDDTALRKAPALFEQLRGHYYIRREFPNYTYSGTPGTEAESVLQALGFRKR